MARDEKLTDCYWKWCSKHFHQQLLKIHGCIIESLMPEIKRLCIRPVHPTEALSQRNLPFLSLEILDLCLREIRAWQGKCLSWFHPVFEKLRFRFLRPCTLTHSLLKFLRFKKHFEKLSYLDGDWCGRRPKRRNKAAFSNFSGLVWSIKLLYSTLLRSNWWQTIVSVLFSANISYHLHAEQFVL